MGYSFNGVNQQLECNSFSVNLPTIGSGAFTINIWAETSVSVQKFILGAGSSETASGGFHLRMGADGKLRFRTRATDYVSDEVYNDGNFNMITVASDGSDGTLRIYKNGVLDTALALQDYNFIDEGTFRIGAPPSGGSPYWNGSIDGCRVYDRRLTDIEILNLYNYRNSVNGTQSGEIGLIYQETSMNLTNWIQEGSHFTDVAGGVQMSAVSFSGFANNIRLNDATNPHNFTALDKWRLRIKFESDDPESGTADGIGLGMKSTHFDEPYGFIARLNMKSNADQGKISIYPRGESFTDQVQDATSGYNLTPGNTYFFEVEMYGFKTFVRLLDADGVTVLNSYNYTYDMDGGERLPNTGQPAIYSFGGTRVINDFEWYSVAKNSVDYVFVGDSNLRGHYAQSIGNRIAEQYITNYDGETMEILAGFADTVTYEVTSRIPEIIALNPTKVIISLMSNDIGKSIAQGTYQSAYTNLIDTLELAGIEVIITTIIPRNDVDVSVENTFINGKPNRVVDWYLRLKAGGGTGLNGAYNNGDGVHLNIAGNTNAADEIFITD